MISIISNGMTGCKVNVVVNAGVFDYLIILMLKFGELRLRVFSGLKIGSILGLILGVRAMRVGRRSMVLIRSNFTISSLMFFIAGLMTISKANEGKVSL